MKTFLLKNQTCPKCAYEMEAASTGSAILAGCQARPPRPGNGTLCIRCGEFSVFDRQLKLRTPTADELKKFEQQEIWPKVLQARQFLRELRQKDILESN